MTYRELLKALKELTEEQLDMNVCVLLTEVKECVDVSDCKLVSEVNKEDEQEIDDNDNQPLLIVPF